MRMLMQVRIPHEPFNTFVRDGSAGERTQAILDEIQPEAVYFTEYYGQRVALLIVDVPEPSAVPSLAEPWFLTFEADVEFHIVMSPEDLGRAGLEELGDRWA